MIHHRGFTAPPGALFGALPGALRGALRNTALPALLAATLAAALLAACGDMEPSATPGGADEGAGAAAAAEEAAGSAAPAVRFADVTEEAGLRFRHFNDATPDRLLPETMGSGAAFFDYDRDGDPDLFLVNGASLTGDRDASPPGALYENRGDGTFRHVTTVAGLDRPMAGMGVAVGDVDNDGWIDLFVSGLGEDRLYRNLGTGDGDGIVRFEDVSRAWGLATGGPGRGGGFSSSAAFLDYDRDGWLDLYVARYVEWTPESDVRCSPDGAQRTYCTPEVYQGARNVLYRNRQGSGFEDVTAATGTGGPAEGPGKSLGVVVVDHDRDGWPDLAVANDTSRNALYRNLGRGGGGGKGGGVRFEEIAVPSGMAYSESGATRGGMGIDAGDIDDDGRVDLVVGNFAQEMTALYRARDGGLYIDDAAQRGVGLPTVLTLTFGTLLFDADADGDLDLALANGHIEPEIAATRPLHSYAQKPQLFANRPRPEAPAGGGEAAGKAEGGGGAEAETGYFRELDPPPGDAFAEPLVGRGLAAADIDLDGDLDLVVTQNGRDARLFENRADPAAWLRVLPVGTESNRSGYGARVTVHAGDRSWTRHLVSGRSYLSASEPVLTFALPGAEAVDRVEVEWPSGSTQTVEQPPLNELLVVEEEPAAR